MLTELREHFCHNNSAKRSLQLDWLAPIYSTQCVDFSTYVCLVLSCVLRMLHIPSIFNHFSTTEIWCEQSINPERKFSTRHININYGNKRGARRHSCRYMNDHKQSETHITAGCLMGGIIIIIRADSRILVLTHPSIENQIYYLASISAAASDETNLMANEISFDMRYNDKCSICGLAIKSSYTLSYTHTHTLTFCIFMYMRMWIVKMENVMLGAKS